MNEMDFLKTLDGTDLWLQLRRYHSNSTPLEVTRGGRWDPKPENSYWEWSADIRTNGEWLTGRGQTAKEALAELEKLLEQKRIGTPK